MFPEEDTIIKEDTEETVEDEEEQEHLAFFRFQEMIKTSKE